VASSTSARLRGPMAVQPLACSAGWAVRGSLEDRFKRVRVVAHGRVVPFLVSAI
jgi:hypothetical protein